MRRMSFFFILLTAVRAGLTISETLLELILCIFTQQRRCTKINTSHKKWREELAFKGGEGGKGEDEKVANLKRAPKKVHLPQR